MKIRPIQKRSPHLLLSILVAIGSISLMPNTANAQLTPPSELALRNAAEQSESLAKVLTSWTQMQGQSITVSNVNARCIGQVCFVFAGGQTLFVSIDEISKDTRDRLIQCNMFGCPTTVTGNLSVFGEKPLLLTRSMIFADETQYISQSPQSASPQQPQNSKTCPPGQKFEWFFNACVNEEKPVTSASTQNLNRGMLQICNLTMGIYGKCPCIVSNSMSAGFTATEFAHLVGKEDRKTTSEQRSEFDRIVNACLSQ